MKLLALILAIFTSNLALTQVLPIDFESDIVTMDFIDFDGGTAAVLDNPKPEGINTSSKVARIIRDGGQIWAGSKIALDAPLDFSTLNAITMKVYTTAPIGTNVKFKLEGAGETERDVQTTVTDAWEVLTWDFTGEPTIYTDLVFMFDFGNTGNGSSSSTFFFDDIEQLFGGTQIDLPVDFEGNSINYTVTDFGGNSSTLVRDPVDMSNSVVEVVKTDGAATWAGTTIGTPAGFATDIPLSLTDSKMTVRVWSPDAGIAIRLKVEDAKDPTHTCETESYTTVAGAWEWMEFDFLNQAMGTELLSIGIERGWIYNMASIFFNFGIDGATAGEKTYYFDDVSFGERPLSIFEHEIEGLEAFPNPAQASWAITSTVEELTLIELFDLQGNLVCTQRPYMQKVTINASTFPEGIYIARIATEAAKSTIKLIKG